MIQQRHEIAADPLLRGTQLQVLCCRTWRRNCGDQTAQNGAAERVIGGDGLPECLGADEKKMRLLVNARAHQIGLAANDGGRNDQIDRLQQLDKRLDLISHAQKLDAAGEEELRESRGLRLLEQQAPGRHAMQHGLARQRIQCPGRNVPQPGNALERLAGRGRSWIRRSLAVGAGQSCQADWVPSHSMSVLFHHGIADPQRAGAW